MTQPAVSRAVTTLEAELGVSLLIRDRRSGIQLTEVGERVIRIFREILLHYEKVDQEVSREKGLETGKVRIGAFPIASSYFIPRIIGQIAKFYPNIEFVIQEGTIAEIRGWMESRQIDAGFIIATDEQPVNAATYPVYQEKMFAVMRDDNPLTDREAITSNDLSRQPMIICRAGYEPPVMEWFQQGGVKPIEKFIIHNYATALNLVREGMAAAIMSELSLINMPERIVKRPLNPLGSREIQLAVPYPEDCSNAVRLFVETALTLFPNA